MMNKAIKLVECDGLGTAQSAHRLRRRRLQHRNRLQVQVIRLRLGRASSTSDLRSTSATDFSPLSASKRTEQPCTMGEHATQRVTSGHFQAADLCPKSGQQMSCQRPWIRRHDLSTRSPSRGNNCAHGSCSTSAAARAKEIELLARGVNA